MDLSYLLYLSFIPTLYIPVFATGALGVSPFKGTLALALMALANSIGYPVFGHLADRHHKFGVISSSIIAIVRLLILRPSFFVRR
jgi:MFS family permease